MEAAISTFVQIFHLASAKSADSGLRKLNPLRGLFLCLGISIRTLSDQAPLETLINIANYRSQIDLNKSEMGRSALGRILMPVHCDRPDLTLGIHAGLAGVRQPLASTNMQHLESIHIRFDDDVHDLLPSNITTFGTFSISVFCHLPAFCQFKQPLLVLNAESVLTSLTASQY